MRLSLVISRAEASRLAGELERTEWDLQATRAVVEEQIKTEEALGTQARELQASLGQARADVDGLRAKIGEQQATPTGPPNCHAMRVSRGS